MSHWKQLVFLSSLICLSSLDVGFAQTGQSDPAMPGEAIERSLLAAEPGQLVQRAMQEGDAARGAILFHGPLLGCGKCHSVNATNIELLGPNLARPRPEESPQQLVDSVLRPSEKIDAKYRTTIVLTADDKTLSGLLLSSEEEDPVRLKLVDSLQEVALAQADVEQISASKNSLMPVGLARQLSHAHEFYDLLKYLIEIRDQGAERAQKLQPTSAQLAIRLPEYEAQIDHAGFISSWKEDQEAYLRGQTVYEGLCINCHGDKTRPGSLASALRFGEGKFKHGSDPFSLYQTLTRGAGLMLPQTWMVPEQKYDVIHYLREEYLKQDNPEQYFEVDEAYLAKLPKGTERGPAPQKIEPWSQADYGPRLVNTYEIGRGGLNIAQKGIALQLDGGPGGVAQGKAWAIFEHDTLRLAGVWTAQGFIDWRGIHFDGRHGVHPHVVGDILLSNPTGPGWAEPGSKSLLDDQRVVGRDGKRYGPLPRAWGQYEGLYQNGSKSILAYRVGQTSLLETHGWQPPQSPEATGIFARHLKIPARNQDMELVLSTLSESKAANWSIHGNQAAARRETSEASDLSRFDGKRYFEVESRGELDFYGKDFTILAQIEAEGDGTIFAIAPPGEEWGPDGQALFLRGGKLTYDVGWVGAVQGGPRLDNGKPHQVAVTWQKETGQAALWVDGRQVAKQRLAPKQVLPEAVLRIGKTADNFPNQSLLKATSLKSVEVYDRILTADELRTTGTQEATAAWNLKDAKEDEEGVWICSDSSGEYPARLMSEEPSVLGYPWLGFFANVPDLQLQLHDRQLTLHIPAGEETLYLTVCNTLVADEAQEATTAQNAELQFASTDPERLSERFDTRPGKPIFPDEVVTPVTFGVDSGDGIAVDLLSIPTQNPWRARVRASGLDFFEDGDRLAMCTWDGDVWIASGLSSLIQETGNAPETASLRWKRIAFGLFQPLGLKIIEGKIFLTCRDQLVRLDDRNGDDFIDYYHSVNSDHQVTEHFHEFAMGLQTDEAGNFYYAKSARHAKTALVPHHGTLLRVSPDGKRTDILANGFRAANGVCLNADGSFIVTDQEGHWNPKNRINWVREGGFYGNMFGYHDVTDESDEAMDPPLCWITNNFDRSPSELLWVPQDAWGPLGGSLLNLSYGYGRVYVVPHEEVDGQIQGGMCTLPIKDLPTGTMRGRFSPFDHQLYLCGLAAWGTNQMMNEGGLYRLRYTGKQLAMPVSLNATSTGVIVSFSEPLSPDTSLDPESFSVKVWSLKRTRNYGSKHYGERELEIEKVILSAKRNELTLLVPDISPTWCMEIRLEVTNSAGRKVERVIHNTIHNLWEG